MTKIDVISPGAREDTSCALLPMIAGVQPTIRRLGAGEALFRKGDRTFGIFRLMAGQIRLVRFTSEGEEVPMHTARAGELFAEASLFSPRYHCDAVALQDSEVLLYAKRELVHRLRDDGDAMWKFAAQMAGRLQNLRTQRELRQIRSAPERVLQSLRLRCDDTGGWKPDGTLKHFAQDIGLTHEALYRALARLEREGYIDRVDGMIFLADSKDSKTSESSSKIVRGKVRKAR